MESKHHRRLGQTKLKAFEVGLGCMGMSEFYGTTDETTSIETLQRALELGVNFYDTADMYGSGANELLLGKVFKPHWHKLIIATKFGIERGAEYPVKHAINGTPDYVKKACDASLKRLGVDVIDLYYLHRLDKNTPIEETVGAMADLVREGKVRYIGLSEVSAKTLERAHHVHPITALQSEYSLWTRDAERELLPLCEKLQISFVAYSPLGRGFLTNTIDSPTILEEGDFRLTVPRFQGEHFTKNQQLVAQLSALAAKKQCTPAQLSLAWVLAKSPLIIPIPGTRRIQYLKDNIAAAAVQLTETEIAELNQLFDPARISGARYAEHSMKNLDKE